LLIKKQIHVLFTHPALISNVLGATIIDASIIYSLISELADIKVLLNPIVAIFLIIALVASTVLGCMFGMSIVWSFIRPLCVRLNGGPFKPDDKVIILSGVHKGKKASVCRLTKGQGGWNLLYLHIEESNRPCLDIFEEYTVLSCHKRGKRN
jgi:hypothetical protein